MGAFILKVALLRIILLVISFEQTEGRQPKMVKFQTNLRGNFTLVPLNMMFGKSKTAISFA